jgi:hypothetical protein
MSRQPTLYPVSIGNGLFARVRRQESIGEACRRLQRTCEHKQRDPQVSCYRCGHRMPERRSTASRREVFGD